MLYAIALGDTVVLDAYLKAHGIYDFECRPHDDFLRSGDSMIRQLRGTEHVSIYRTYLKHPVPQEIKDELLKSRLWEDHPSEIMRLLMMHGASLELFGTNCQCSMAPRFFAFMDTLGYEFNRISPNTGNNILMDYCSCTKDRVAFPNEFEEIIRFFVKKGVLTDIKNHQGETAFDIANRSGVIELLREAEKE